MSSNLGDGRKSAIQNGDEKADAVEIYDTYKKNGDKG